MRTYIFVALLMVVAGLPVQAQRHRGGIPPYGPLERLNRMSPEQRDKFLQKLSPERRDALERRLERYNRTSPEEKKRLKAQYESFRQLPPEKQEKVRRHFRGMNHLGKDRRPEVRREIHKLRRLNDEDRLARVNSEQFRSRFDAQEREIIENLSSIRPE